MSRGEVVAGDALGRAPPEPDDLAGAGDDLEAEHVVAGDAVLEAADAAGVGGDVAADRRPGGAGRVRRVPEAVLGAGRPQPVVDDARLDDGEALDGVDLEDPVHGVERDDDAAGHRVRAAGEAGAGAAGDDRDAVRGAEPHGGGDVLGAHRPHDRRRDHVGGPLGLVVTVPRPGLLTGEHLGAEQLHQVLADLGVGQPRGGGRVRCRAGAEALGEGDGHVVLLRWVGRSLNRRVARRRRTTDELSVVRPDHGDSVYTGAHSTGAPLP